MIGGDQQNCDLGQKDQGETSTQAGGLSPRFLSRCRTAQATSGAAMSWGAASGSEIGWTAVSPRGGGNPDLSVRSWAQKPRGLDEGRAHHSLGGPRG